jgi:hypothetical protein
MPEKRNFSSILLHSIGNFTSAQTSWLFPLNKICYKRNPLYIVAASMTLHVSTIPAFLKSCKSSRPANYLVDDNDLGRYRKKKKNGRRRNAQSIWSWKCGLLRLRKM